MWNEKCRSVDISEKCRRVMEKGNIFFAVESKRARGINDEMTGGVCGRRNVETWI